MFAAAVLFRPLCDGSDPAALGGQAAVQRDTGSCCHALLLAGESKISGIWIAVQVLRLFSSLIYSISLQR